MSIRQTTDEQMNNLIAAGGVYMVLNMAAQNHATLTSVEPVVDETGTATNQIDVTFDFLKSPYRLTIERVPDPRVTP